MVNGRFRRARELYAEFQTEAEKGAEVGGVVGEIVGTEFVVGQVEDAVVVFFLIVTNKNIFCILPFTYI